MSDLNATQISSVSISGAIDKQRDLREKVDLANAELQKLVGPSASQAAVEWKLTKDATGRLLLVLKLSDSTGYAETRFEPAEFEDLRILRFKLHGIWGDLLVARSHKQLEKLLQSTG
jgi:hypothetical protein